MPIDMNGAASAVDGLESALSHHAGSAANWETVTEYLSSHKRSSGDASAALSLKSVIPLPPAFISQYTAFQHKSFMGLFPEIGRVWLTADSRLFLWSYGEDAVLRGAAVVDDFYAFEDLDQIIVAVALVRPRPGVFVDDVQYIVAVATPVEVTLLGVAFSGDGTAASEISLLPTNISVPTDGVVMLSLTGTPDGRIFMAGSDGNLHEFAYYGPPTGWASTVFGSRAAKRPRKLVHNSSSLVNYVIPTAVKDYFAPTDELVDIAVDAANNSLYTLSASGSLAVYDISGEGNASLVRCVDVSVEAKSLLSFVLPANEREYISIFPVLPHLSSSVQLVVVSSFGERIYFGTSASSTCAPSSSSASAVDFASTGSQSAMPSVRVGFKRSAPEASSSLFGRDVGGDKGGKRTQRKPTTLECVGYRGTPVTDSGGPTNRPCFHNALWAAGSVIMCDLRSSDHDRMYSVFPDPAAGRVPGLSGADCGSGAIGSAGESGSGTPASSGTPRALNPPAGQARPVECVHFASLGVGDARAGFGDGFSGAGTPRREGEVSGQSPSVRTFAIAPVETKSGIRRDGEKPRTVPPLVQSTSMFWVLTSTALRLYARIEPKQRLSAILSSSTAGVDERGLVAFFNHHGPVEASAICLDLGTSEPSLTAAAARALYNHGGRSRMRSERTGGGLGGQYNGTDGGGAGDSGDLGVFAGIPGRLSIFGARRHSSSPFERRQLPGFDLGRPTQRQAAVASFSGVHDGVCVFAAHALQPIWNEFICTSRDPSEYQQMVFTPDELEKSREVLCALVSFLDQHDPDSMLPFEEEDAESQGAGLQAGSGAARDGYRPGGILRSGYSRDGGGSLQSFGLGQPITPTTPGGRNSFERGHSRGPAVARARKSSEARRAEVGAIHNLKQLALRCSEALAFLSILCDHQLHRVVPALQSTMRGEFVNMKFCDLVARTPGATVSSALIEVLFGSFAAGGSDLGPLSKLLQNRCQSYFDDGDMTLQNSMQRIQAASELLGIPKPADDFDWDDDSRPLTSSPILDEASYIDKDEALKLAEDAVQLLKPLSSRIHNIESVCGHVALVGAVPAAIELALAYGDAADRDSDDTRSSVAYKCVLRMVEPLIEQCADADMGSSSGENSTPISTLHRSPGKSPGRAGQGRRRVPIDLERKKDAAMRVALSSSSDRFHETLYERLMQSKPGEREILCRPSPRVDSYLKANGRKDLMWKYYAQHGRHGDAAAVLLGLAEDDTTDASLVDRLGHLSRALHNAKTAVSAGDTKAAALETDIKDYMDVARVQLRLRDELTLSNQSTLDIEKIQKDLDSCILDLTVLYNDYAARYDLLESTLDVLRCASYRDDSQVNNLWTRIVDEELKKSGLPSMLEQKIVALGRDFYPSDVIFRTRFLIDLLERKTFEFRDEPAWESVEPGWVSRAFVQIGVPLGEIVDSYRAMIESNPHQLTSSGTPSPAWADEESQLHAIAGARCTLSMWADRATVGSGHYNVEKRMLFAESEKAFRTIALCKSRLRAMSKNSTNDYLREQMDSIETAISVPY